MNYLKLHWALETISKNTEQLELARTDGVRAGKQEKLIMKPKQHHYFRVRRTPEEKKMPLSDWGPPWPTIYL